VGAGIGTPVSSDKNAFLAEFKVVLKADQQTVIVKNYSIAFKCKIRFDAHRRVRQGEKADQGLKKER
jgi:hypothetical protein